MTNFSFFSLRGLAAGCGGTAMLLAATSLAGWITHHLFLASFGRTFIMMAPSTAIVFLSLGLGLVVAAAGRPSSRWICRVLPGISALACLVILLLVEDEPTNALLAQTILEQQGAKVKAVTRGADALAAFGAGGSFDLVLLDLHLPEMSGIDLARAIRAGDNQASVPILAVTADVTTEARQRAREAGMDGFVAKPLTIELLMDAVAAITKPRELYQT